MRLVTGSLKHENLHGPWLLLLFSLCTIGRTESKLGRCPSLIDSHPMYCRNNVSACSSDSDCKDDLKCCSDGCARVCVEPRFSACEHRLLSVQQQLTSWDEGEFSLSRPTCKTNGAFEPIQCRSTSEECWCVNDSGFEIAGTRAASRQLVNCSAPKLCSGLMCRMLCPYDFELDERGCPLCQCRDPCSGVKCPGNHECHLEDVDCDSEPCPPVPSCKQPRFMDTVCPSGEPLFLSEKNQPFLCGLEDNQPQCPPFFKCIVQENMEYGSCCPSFEDVDKPGKCPPLHFASECGESCSSDSDCIGLLKCCQSEVCGSHCTASNSTVCEQQKMLAELMSRNEKHNHGYIPQCTEVGDFKMKQCSLNGLVCWCVTKEGKKISHTMGPAEKVICTLEEEISSSSTCDNVICSTFCGYGYKLNEDGCQTCDCEQPCDEFNCPDGTRCLIKPDESCIESFCPPVPTCELVHHHRELSFDCPPAKHQECFNETKCMSDEECTNNSKCCPNACGSTCNTELQLSNRLPTMCEYLRSFALTVADSSIAYSPAYPIPSCTKEGLYDPLQCNNIGECWCVDEFGAELLGTRGHSKDINCTLARNRSRCSGLMCRLGCDYGFKKDDKGCSLCECRNPCDTLECQEGMECQLVEMESFCTTSFCPAIPQCLSKGKSSSQCAVGDPLWNSSSKGYWICGLDNRECPETYVCIKDEDSSTGGFCCLKSVELACNEAKTIGSCDESIQRWHHNNDTGRCERFIYSGCGGNNNNFVSKQACETTCVVNFGISPKNGSCPEISADEIGLCATECLTDGECPGPQKCCLNECEAYVCRDPSGSTGKAGQCPFLISTKSELCDFQCKSDFECEGELKCCSNGCGTSCIEPEMKTACEHQRDIGEYKIRQAGVPSSLVFIPKCQEDGQFFNIQCSIINQTCWCVNDIGMEIPGTRSYNSTLPNCGDPARCPSTQCKITCEYGYELDSQGCALCTCCDPCSDFICTDTEECRLVQVQCATTPCPPIPICLPKIENPCLHGEPLQDEESKNVIKCGPHGMQCPSTHQCHLSPLGEFAVCCPKTRNTCLQPFDSGHCMAAIQRWHFDPVENICKEFQYGGCGGNQNNFQSKEDCEKTCPTLSHCEQLREESLKNMNQNAFIPKCNSKTNLWESVQCLDSIGVCWCVNSNGEEIPGSLVKGQPTCTSRAGRKFMHPTHLNICENTAVHDCSPSTCEDKVCLAYPDAVCRIDPCGGCSVNFYNVSGILVDCNEGLSRCQVELQTVLNSDAWLNERDLMFHLILNDTDSRKSLKKRDLLSGTLSFLKHLMQGIDEDLPKQPLDFLPPKMVEDFSSETSSEDSHSMGVVLPQCLANGDYSPIQMYKSLKWCVTADGEPLHNSLTQRNVKCLSEGKFIQQKSFTSLCDESKRAKVCKTECLNAKCPSHPEAVCEADPCNECSVKFTTKDGKSVNCQTKCLQPVEVGFCRASFRNWFYNQTSGDCEEFIFGGCLGNDNNFESYESCVDECKHPVDVCQLPKETGMCRASMHRWYYNSLTRKCEEFIYGGCDGNQNNFETKEECDAICPDVVLCNQLDDTKKLTACSRQNTCQRKICFGHEDAVCTVDSCNNCNPVFVDLDGVKIKCEVIDTNVTSETGVGISSTEKDAIIMHSKKKTRCEKQRLWAILHNGHIPDCDKDGRFKPMQCDDRNVQELQPFCWCIDEAGNQVQGTVHFIKGTQKCKYMRIMKIEVTLVFSWPKDEDLNANETLVIQALNTFLPKTNIRRNLNLTVETRSDAVVVKFILDDADKVDAADALEEQIKSGQLALILDGHVLYAIHSASVFRHDVETKAQFENHESLSSGSITVITIITLLTMILICLLIGGVLIYRRKKVGMYPKGSLESLASSTTQLHVYDSKKHLDMSSPLLHNLKCEHDTKKLTVSTVEHEYAVISPTQLDQTKHVVV